MCVNVLLVVLDAVRASNCGLYTPEKDTTPFLQELSTRSTVYTQARSTGCWSLPGHAGLFTGYIPEEHGVRTEGAKLEPGHTIWETLRDQGHRTGVFSYNGFLRTNRNGLTYGFDRTVNEFPPRLYPDAIAPQDVELPYSVRRFPAYLSACLAHDRPIRSLSNGVYEFLTEMDRSDRSQHFIDRFLEWLAEAEGQWAACLNLLDAHHEYIPHEDERAELADLLSMQTTDGNYTHEFYGGIRPWEQLSRLEALYDSAIRRLDAKLRYLVAELRRRGEYEDTLIVITADHGEGFGEESRVDPGYRVVAHHGSIHEVLFHVPLVVKHPGQSTGERSISLASLTRFPDVVRGALQGTRRSFAQDRVLTSAKTPRGPRERSLLADYCEETDWAHRYRRALYVETDDGSIHKYMTSESDVDDHSTGVGISIRGSDPDEALLRSAFFDAWDGVDSNDLSTDTTDELDDQTEARLRELGYIS